MSTEPMVTIKQADGTFAQVPLSQLQQSAAVPTEDAAPMVADESIEDLVSAAAAQVSAEASGAVEPEVAPDGAAASSAPTATGESDLESTVDMTVSPATSSADSTAVSDTTTASIEEPEYIDRAIEEKLSPTPEAVPTIDDTEADNADDTTAVPTDEAAALPVSVPPAELPATTTPNVHIFEESAPTDWDRDDHSSLLEESLTQADIDIPHETKRPGTVGALAAGAIVANTIAPVSPISSPKKPSIKHDFAAVDRSQIPYMPVTERVPMHDIATPTLSMDSVPRDHVVPMGPVAELERMTLDDFRRLGGRGTVGIAELRTKFELLLKESILLYMQAVMAWHRSPLYQHYLAIIIESLKTGIPIPALLDDPSYDITKEEWMALVQLHQDIRL